MIYLKKGYDDKTPEEYLSGVTPILKIGYASDLKKRSICYNCCGNISDFISYKDGDLIDELAFQLYFRYYRYSKFNEWFYFKEEIIQKFKNITEKEVYESLWKDKEELFSNIRSIGDTKYDNLIIRLIEKNKEEISKEYHKFISNNTFYSKFWIAIFIYYKDNHILPELEKSFMSNLEERIIKIVDYFLGNHFYKTGIFEEKMKLYCEFLDNYGGDPGIQKMLYYKIENPKFRQYYRFFGTSGCRTVSYKEALLERRFKDSSRVTDLGNQIYQIFKPGDRYTKKQ